MPAIEEKLSRPENLSVFAGSPPAEALNFRVHELLTASPPRRKYTTVEAWQSRKLELMDRLRKSVFRALGKTNLDLQIEVSAATPNNPFREITFSSEPGIRLRALYRGPSAESSAAWPALLYVASDGEDDESIRRTLTQLLGEEKALMIVFPRGVGEIPWNKVTYRDMLRNAMHVGCTVDSMRLWDVLQSLEVLKRQNRVDLRRITILGRSGSGILALYAAILDESIAQVMLIDPPVSHRQGPIFLNILRYSDLPETAALLAPRRLVFYGRIPEEYDYTQSVYRLLGTPDHLSFSMSIRAVLDQRYDHNFSSGY